MSSSGSGQPDQSGNQNLAKSRAQQMSTQRPTDMPNNHAHAIRSQSFAATSVPVEPSASLVSHVTNTRGTSLEPTSLMGSNHNNPPYNRRSQEGGIGGRAVQAVPPFGVRDATSIIPNDCQVMKQLVREAVVSGQLDNQLAQANSSSASDVNDNRRPPPAYPGNNPTQQPNPTSPHVVNVNRTQFNFGQNAGHNFGQHLPRPSSVAGLAQGLPQGSPQAQMTQQQLLSNMLHQYQAYQSLLNTEQTQLQPQTPAQSRPQPKCKMSVSHPDLSSVFSMTSADQQTHEQNVKRRGAGPAAGGADNHQHYLSTPNRYDAIQPRHIIQVTADRAHSVGHHPAFGGGYGVPPPPPYFNQQMHMGATDTDMQMRNYAGVRECSEVEARVTSRMFSLLTDENKSLRSELEIYIKKCLKLQQLELQYQKIQREYEDLARRQEKNYGLEQQMRDKMQNEIDRLEKQNQYFKDQLSVALEQLQTYPDEEQDTNELKHELTRLNMILAHILPQNKELLACKERQEIEMQAQTATLEEQRTHIHILDKALSNAQEKVIRLEEECRKKMNAVSRVERMHETLAKAHADLQKRDEQHKRDKAQLHKELAQLQLLKTRDSKKGSSSALRDTDDSSQVGRLRRSLENKEEEIVALKKTVVDWEKKYYDEMKHKDTEQSIEDRDRFERIRELEEDSEKSEKIMEDTQHENDQYRHKLRDANNIITAYETKLKLFEARLIEKDAMIKVLRRQGSDDKTQEGDRNRTSYSTGAKATGDWVPYSAVDVTRSRLEAVRMRLLQSPSPVRYNRLYHPRMNHHSLDTTYGLEDTHSDFSSLERHHAHLKEGRLYGSGGHDRCASSCDPALAALAGKPRQIFTLPASVRKKRSNSLLGAVGREGRPKSTDEHLLFPKGHTVAGTSPRGSLGRQKDASICEVGEYEERTIKKVSRISLGNIGKRSPNSKHVAEKEGVGHESDSDTSESPPEVIHV